MPACIDLDNARLACHRFDMEPTQYDLALGRVLRRKRAAAGLSQTKAASALGLTFQQIQKYEKGANRVSFSRFLPLAEVYGTTPEQIIADVRAELQLQASDEPVNDDPRTIRLIRLANAVPEATLDKVIDLLSAVAKDQRRGDPS